MYFFILDRKACLHIVDFFFFLTNQMLGFIELALPKGLFNMKPNWKDYENAPLSFLVP